MCFKKLYFVFLKVNRIILLITNFFEGYSNSKFSNKKISANRVTLTDGGGYRKDYEYFQ